MSSRMAAHQDVRIPEFSAAAPVGSVAFVASVHSNSASHVSFSPSTSNTTSPLTLSAHWTLSLGRVLLYPLENAVLLSVSF
jgi:hypothetical protein